MLLLKVGAVTRSNSPEKKEKAKDERQKKGTRKASSLFRKIINNMGDRSKIRERTSSATDKPEKPVASTSYATASKELEDTAAIRNRLVVVNDRRVTTLTAKFFAFIRAAESFTTTLDEVYPPQPTINPLFNLLFNLLSSRLIGSNNLAQGTGGGPNPEGVRPV
jgi:hypothetical protein